LFYLDDGVPQISLASGSDKSVELTVCVHAALGMAIEETQRLPLGSGSWRIGLTKDIGPGVHVSTIECFGVVDDLLPYETKVFGGDHDHWVKRYDTAEHAYAGHVAVVAWLRGVGEEPSR
jgi:hypothetical protein